MGILLSRKIIEATSGTYTHWCPGCESRHLINTTSQNANKAIWTYNHNHESPTFHPSVNMRIESGSEVRVCHYIITDGQIMYCSDTTHKFSGMSIPLPDFPEHIIGYHTAPILHTTI